MAFYKGTVCYRIPYSEGSLGVPLDIQKSYEEKMKRLFTFTLVAIAAAYAARRLYTSYLEHA